MLSKRIPYKYHIYALCRLYERPINLIVYLKFTMLSTQILVHCAVKSHVYHVKYTDFI